MDRFDLRVQAIRERSRAGLQQIPLPLLLKQRRVNLQLRQTLKRINSIYPEIVHLIPNRLLRKSPVATLQSPSPKTQRPLHQQPPLIRNGLHPSQPLRQPPAPAISALRSADPPLIRHLQQEQRILHPLQLLLTEQEVPHPTS